MEQTIVMPIFNGGAVAAENMAAALELLDSPTDVICIFDSCTDDCEKLVIEVVDEAMARGRVRTLLAVATPNEFFETACDNLGFMASTTKYVIELQSDMRIIEGAWDARLRAPFSYYDDLLCVGGRSCHTWHWLQTKWSRRPARTLRQNVRLRLRPSGRPMDLRDFRRLDVFGALDLRDFGDPHFYTRVKRDLLFLKDTVNRGPIAYRRDYLEGLGYLDESAFFLGHDEHDLALRAWSGQRLRTAYLPLLVKSDIGWGAERRTRSPQTIRRMHELAAAKESGVRGSTLARYLNDEVKVPRPREEVRRIARD